MDEKRTYDIAELKKYKKRSMLGEIWRNYRKSPSAMVGLAIVILLIIITIAAQVMYVYNEDIVYNDMQNRLLKPSMEHWFGTDQYGRDVFVRIIYGAKYSLSVGIVSVMIACGLGMCLGLVAGYYGGIVENIILRTCEIFIGIPSILMGVALMSAFGQGLGVLMLAIGLVYTPLFARTTRAAVLPVRDAEYIEISKLAKMTGRTKEEVLDDLHKLMDQKILTQAWIDDQETTLILTEEVYNQYQEIRAQSERLRRQAEQVQEADADLPENAREIIKEGQDYIRTIHSLNEDIPGAQMSEKLYRLEGTMERIMEQVRKNPESASELRKLMSYYLPTTVKLLNAYKELDKQAAGGDNITKTKKEIEDALDTINDAFERLLDSLFQSMAWDVSSDISVMQTMFAQDGLTGQRIRETQVSGAGASAQPSDEAQASGMPQGAGSGTGTETVPQSMPAQSAVSAVNAGEDAFDSYTDGFTEGLADEEAGGIQLKFGE